MSAAAIAALKQALGPAGWAEDPATLEPHLREWRGRALGATPLLVMPANTAEVAAVVRICAAGGLAITPQGGNTGLVGGQIPQGEVLLSLKRMTRIRAIEPADDALVVEAGVTLEAVHAAAAGAGRQFPLALGSGGSATIGGLVSTNAGGVHVLRFGMMRDLVLGLEAVLADGTVLDGLSALRKNNTGYDLKQLFIGAEGTLGVVTAASLRLFPRPAEHQVAAAAVESPAAALALLHLAKAETGALAAFELMNRFAVELTAASVEGVRNPLPGAAWLVLLEFESAQAGLAPVIEAVLAKALERGLIADAALAQSEAQAAAFWKLRESIPAAHRGQGAQVNGDISVPVSAVPRFLAAAEAAAAAILPDPRIVAFGHAGDGNIHYTVLQAEAAQKPDPAFTARAGEILHAVQAVAVGLGGSISAEHGIGVFRREELPRYKDPAALALMRRLKQALDPAGVFNPRALLSLP